MVFKKGWKKKTDPSNYNEILSEDKEILGAVNQIQIEDIAAKWIFIAGIDYRNGEIGKFKRMMDSLYAIMSPDLSPEINIWVEEEQKKIDTYVEKVAKENRRDAMTLRENLEIRHYYELWKKLMKEMFAKGWAGTKEVMLDEN